MAYTCVPKNTSKYSQNIQFTYNKTPYDSYSTAVKMVTKKNLLPGEPAACFYKTDDDQLKMLLAIGTTHNYETPLILTESLNSGELNEKIEDILEKLGSSSIQTTYNNDGHIEIISNVSDLINLIVQKLGLEPIDSLQDEIPENWNAISAINELMNAVKTIIINHSALIAGNDEEGEYTGSDKWEKVYSIGRMNQLLEDLSIPFRWRNVGDTEYDVTYIGINEGPTTLMVDGGEVIF